MRFVYWCAAICCLMVLCVPACRSNRVQAAEPKAYAADPGPAAVEVLELDWTDARRHRPVPAKIYYPAGEEPCPIVIFSHGLGGSRDGYEYLGRYWASYGYVSVHLTHTGSDTEVWQGKADPLGEMRRAAADPRNAIARPLDVRFTIDQLTALQQAEGQLQGRLDLAHIAVAGHSFGAFTALATAGMVFPVARRNYTLDDLRVSVAIVMSPPVTRRPDLWATIYGGVRLPGLHMTGTLDESIINDTTAAERRIPYDHIFGADQYLLTFQGGDHMIFSGRGNARQERNNDAFFQRYIKACTLAFLDAYLRGDAGAKAWLAEGGFAAHLGDAGVWEQRLAEQALLHRD